MSQGNSLTIAVEKRDGFAVIRVEGRVIRENQARLRAELETLVLDGTPNIALDLKQVQYMDSSGLGCFSSVEKFLQDRGSGHLAVFGASSNVEKTWRMIRLDLVIPLFAKEEEAVAWLANPS